MSWTVLDQKAMAALIAGDEDKAIALWSEAVTTIENTQPEASVEVGQVYFRLGKCLADNKDYDRAIPLMQKAESTIFEADPNSEVFQQLRYALGSTLSKAGRSAEAEIPMKKAMGIIDVPVAACLVGPKDDDISIRQLVSVFQKMGLAAELDKKEFTRIKKAIVKVGRASAGDENSILPLDLLYTYYLPEERRRADKFVTFQNFKAEYDLPTLINDMNLSLDMVLFEPGDIVSVNEQNEESVFYLIVDPEDGPMAARLQPGNEWNDLVCVINSKLMYLGDDRRFLRVESMDDQEQALMLVSQAQAVSLYRAGAGWIFENLSQDLEPMPPLLVSLEAE